jgi:CDP-glucose 4,6-dehydratase
VLEPLSGYMMLAEKMALEGPRWGGAWNFGPGEGDTKPVGWIADRLAVEWGGEAAWATDTLPHPHEANWLKLDCSKARQQLGWIPRWRLGRALQAIVAWHKAHDRGQDMREMTLNQINEFERTIPNE